MTLRFTLSGLLLLTLLLSPTHAQTMDEGQEFAPPYVGTEGPTQGSLGGLATIDVPEGHAFLDGVNTGVLLDMWGNIPGGEELGALIPNEFPPSWALMFEFDEVGYIPDDEKDDLDADAMIESMREGQEYHNQTLAERGYPQLHIDRWLVTPRYNPQTNNLEWALLLTSPNAPDSVNHSIRLLGRSGVMRTQLLCDPEDHQTALAQVTSMLESFQYNTGNSYAEYREGDKIAKYGLAALVTGGAAALALKTGLLQKLLKPLLFAAVAVAVFFKKIWAKITGRG